MINMLTNVQKETVQTLINLYQSSNGNSIKCEKIAEIINRSPGTIRNQMISLRRMGLVKSMSGPGGGYKPTIEAYSALNISISEEDCNVPIYNQGRQIKNVSVAKIEFTSVPQPNECNAEIKVLGSINNLDLGDEIIIGPTPVNNLGIIGTIVGRDDLDNILLVDTKTIRSIPNKTVGDIATYNIVSFTPEYSIKDAAKKLAKNNIDGAPVIKNDKIVGIFTLTDIVNAIANDNENSTVGALMSTKVITVDKNLKIVNAIELIQKKSISRLIITNDNQSLLGIVTRTDLIESIVNFEQIPMVINK